MKRSLPPIAAALPFAATAFFAPLPAAADCEPTNLRFATPFLQSGSVELSWVDNCDHEDGFEVQFSNDGITDWTTFVSPAPDSTLIPIIGGGPGSVFHFRLRAVWPDGNSDWTAPVEVALPSEIAIRHSTFGGGTVGEPFTGPTPNVFTSTPGGTASSFSVADLPEGFTFDTDTGIIGGTPTAPGVFRPIVSATDGTNTASTFVTLRITPATTGPVLITPLPDFLSLTPSGGPVLLNLGEHFTDPDTTEAVRIATNLGDIDTILYPSATPVTVKNFFNYVDRGAYADVLFHRSATLASSGVAVVQAGWFKPDGQGGYERIPADQGVIDEPGLSNLTGSFAMAKTGQPNSGTSQWYFNTIDNTNLDGAQSNGGYTVFGRATTPSLPLLANMHARPRGNYAVMLDGVTTTISDWPTTGVPAGETPAPEELIQISSVTHIEEFLFYTVENNSNPELVSAAVSGSELTLTPVPGTTGTGTITIGATDLDGTLLQAELSYCILDLDLQAGLSPAGNLAATFNHEKAPAHLTYEVQRSLDGQSWTTLWKTTDGLNATPVVANPDLGSYWRPTIEDPTITPPSTETALVRVVVSKQK